MASKNLAKGPDLRPGTKEGDAYLTRKANERRRQGYVGFTRKGRMGDYAEGFGHTDARHNSNRNRKLR